MIDEAEPLDENEIAEKEQLAAQGFGEWNKRDFQQFINGSARYGRTDYENIALEVDSKQAEDIKVYAKVFWKRYKEISNWEKHISAIKEGEQKAQRVVEQADMLRKKLKMYRVPLQQLKLNYTVSTTNKKVYTEEEDRFLLVMLDKYGLDREGVYDLIRDEIRESPLFRFDWFFLSRTPQEISRRCTTLITTVAKEMEGGTGKENKRAVEDEESEEIEEPTKKKSRASTGGAKVSRHYCIVTKNDHVLIASQNKVVNGVKATPNGSSRAASVDTNGSAGGSAKKGRSRKR